MNNPIFTATRPVVAALACALASASAPAQTLVAELQDLEYPSVPLRSTALVGATNIGTPDVLSVRRLPMALYQATESHRAAVLRTAAPVLCRRSPKVPFMGQHALIADANGWLPTSVVVGVPPLPGGYVPYRYGSSVGAVGGVPPVPGLSYDADLRRVTTTNGFSDCVMIDTTAFRGDEALLAREELDCPGIRVDPSSAQFGMSVANPNPDRIAFSGFQEIGSLAIEPWSLPEIGGVKRYGFLVRHRATGSASLADMDAITVSVREWFPTANGETPVFQRNLDNASAWSCEAYRANSESQQPDAPNAYCGERANLRFNQGYMTVDGAHIAPGGCLKFQADRTILSGGGVSSAPSGKIVAALFVGQAHEPQNHVVIDF